jgi:hypothetical protein
MSLSQSICSTCGKAFDADTGDRYYSVLVDNKGYLTEVVSGELVPDAFHYCSESCMFKREQGVVTRIDLYHNDRNMFPQDSMSDDARS